MAAHEDRVLRLVADERNRAILTALDEVGRCLPAVELAERLVTRDAAIVSSSAYEQTVERVLISLHHNRLPRLDEAGLVEYDRDENVVGAADGDALDAEWPNGIIEALSRFRSGGRPDADTIGVMEGRETVYDYGRRLSDEAEDELFLMYVSDDLLDEDCLSHARDAIERGVDFYAGSQNPDVRDFFRRHLPEATLWEPQLDWMNDPSKYPRVDRLIFADREKVVFGLLDEPDDDAATERAMFGEGPENPLVVLVRELLGSRLDHLDYQSDEFRNRLPFYS